MATFKLTLVELQILTQLIEEFEKIGGPSKLPPDLIEPYKSVRSKIVGEERLCKRCGKRFVARRWDHIYCSNRCRETFLKNLQRHPELRAKVNTEMEETKEE